MKKSAILLSILVLFLVGFCARVALADDDPGKKIFLDNKCNACHSVDSQNIKKTMESSKAPDLSNVGAEKTEEWITKWLKKEVDIDGKKHPKTWSGTDDDLTTLVKWLGTLKKA
jgi:cytochrome c551/c552